MTVRQLEQDLKRCLTLISADWRMQSNRRDRQSSFIYQAQTLDECLALIEKYKIDKDYALHRWYNYKTSTECENMFCKAGAVKEQNKFNHNVDLYINGIPFDVKLTVYPAKLSDKPYDLTTQNGRDCMINWFYANQSQQDRKQLVNRIYVVCDAGSADENLKLKSDFALIESQIQQFMQQVLAKGVNKITVIDQGQEYTVYSDMVYVKKQN